jgi:hypothetical protein
MNDNAAHDAANDAANDAATAAEVKIQDIELDGAAKDRNTEISGMAWCGDHLVLLPQYPSVSSLAPGRNPKLYTLKKTEILNYLDMAKTNKKPAPLEPRPIPILLEASLYSRIRKIQGCEGFEAIAFRGDSVFVLLEASPGSMEGLLVKGKVNRDTRSKDSGDIVGITLQDHPSPVKLEAQAPIDNAAYETLLVTPKRVYAFYEGNGRNINKNPAALVFDHHLKPLGKATFPAIEYRLTDATEIDGSNRFWCTNYQWAGDINKYKPAPDPLFNTYGKGKTHQHSSAVERLVEFQCVESGDGCHFKLVERPPIQLELQGKARNDSRNWEGIVRLDNRGFLIVTDKFPRTILAFVPFN